MNKKDGAQELKQPTVWHEVIPNQTERSLLFREDDCYECDTWRMQGVDPNGTGNSVKNEILTCENPIFFESLRKEVCPFEKESNYIRHSECGYTGTPSYHNNGWTKQLVGHIQAKM